MIYVKCIACCVNFAVYCFIVMLTTRTFDGVLVTIRWTAVMWYRRFIYLIYVVSVSKIEEVFLTPICCI